MKVVNDSKKMALYKLLNMFLYGVSSEQHVANVNVKKCRKENVKVLMENWLYRFM